MAEQLDRRQALVEAAFRTIAERGFEGLRLRPIAARAGIDHSTLHHYFKTKDDLIAAVLEHATGQLEGTMRMHLPPAERLRHHLVAVGTAVTEQPALFTVLDELDLRARRDEAMAANAEQDEQGWRDALAALFEEGVEAGTWSRDLDVNASVELVIATLKGIRLRPSTAREVVTQLSDLFSAPSSTGD